MHTKSSRDERRVSIDHAVGSHGWEIRLSACGEWIEADVEGWGLYFLRASRLGEIKVDMLGVGHAPIEGLWWVTTPQMAGVRFENRDLAEAFVSELLSAGGGR